MHTRPGYLYRPDVYPAERFLETCLTIAIDDDLSRLRIVVAPFLLSCSFPLKKRPIVPGTDQLNAVVFTVVR